MSAGASSKTWAVVLAAGGSRRMGTPKQLLPWEGEPLVRRAVLAASSVLAERVILVTGYCAEQVEEAVANTGVRTLRNPLWTEGLASSLRVAVAALPADCDGVVFCSCDQPGIGAPQIQALLEARSGERIVAASYAGTLGIPACFPRSSFKALSGLSGEHGAKTLLGESQDLIQVAIPQGEWDLDEPGDIPLVASAIGLYTKNDT